MAQKIMTPAEFYKSLKAEDRKSVVNLGKVEKLDIIPTGSWVINSLIGDGSNTSKPGGLPRGHIVEVFGDESSGKSTLALSACKQTQDIGGVPIYLDFERTFSKDYALGLGLDLDPNKFILIEPDHFQHGAKFIMDALAMRPPLIVTDSVSAMTPKEFLEGQVDEGGRMGLQAQLMSAFLSYVTKFLKPSNTCLLFLNQMRAVINTGFVYPGAPKEESSGGYALRFYSSVRIKLNKGAVQRLDSLSKVTGKLEKKAVNIAVRVSIIKNKIDRPYLQGPVYIRFGEGFDNILSVIDLGINIGRIQKAGSFLQFKSGEEILFKVQGKEQLRELLIKDSKIFEAVRSSLTFKEDEEARLQGEAEEREQASLEGKDMDAVLSNVSETFIKKRKGKEEAKEENHD